ncbi:MAG: glycine cleavage system protein GcvH [Verrucomicrobiae bacterium]|nr:glycine cleavage system protein GcvH [Verrucomicrobiae bacterium]
MNVPNQLKYAASHEWLSVQNDIGTIGITDHAQQELSDVVYVQLPEVGRKVATKEATAVVESVKAASDIYSPVSGEVVEVNTALENDPALVNSEPYEKGWIFKVKLSQPDETNALMDAANYSKQIGA